MPTICIQCAMRAMVKGETAPYFEEEPEEHDHLVHPDPVATQKERAELEKQLLEMYQNGVIPKAH